MRKIALVLVPLLGVALAKAEAPAEKVAAEMTAQVLLGPGGPGKNYRAQMARAYFGSGSKCRNWKRFCGR